MDGMKPNTWKLPLFERLTCNRTIDQLLAEEKPKFTLQKKSYSWTRTPRSSQNLTCKWIPGEWGRKLMTPEREAGTLFAWLSMSRIWRHDGQRHRIWRWQHRWWSGYPKKDVTQHTTLLLANDDHDMQISLRNPWDDHCYYTNSLVCEALWVRARPHDLIINLTGKSYSNVILIHFNLSKAINGKKGYLP